MTETSETKNSIKLFEERQVRAGIADVGKVFLRVWETLIAARRLDAGARDGRRVK